MERHKAFATIRRRNANHPVPLTVVRWEYWWLDRDNMFSILVEFGMPMYDNINIQESEHPCFYVDGYLDGFYIQEHPSEWSSNVRFLDTSTDITTTTGKQALQWLRTCVLSHPECEHLRDADWYPTRLLHLGSSGENQTDGTIRVIETQDEPPSGPYVTLSHCWGDINMLKLTTDSLSDYKHGIHMADLPKTFSDAVAVARCLHVQYLWIDSLTIIQDSEEDWARESVTMDRVYQNSLCNISAAASTNSLGGLFFDRRPELLLPPLIVYEDQNYQVEWDGDWNEALENEPLMQRAWTVQERWLSPRMLHFCRDQVYWECKTITVSEQAPEQMSIGIHSLSSRLNLTQTNNAAAMYETWWQAIEFYTKANLTFATDKLVAFAGIAKVMQRVMKGRYLAGLWEKDFISQLSWFIMAEPGRPQEYIAPSWSWASVHGRVCMDSNQYCYSSEACIRELASMLHIHIEYRGADLFGQVKDGYLRLVGPLLEVQSIADDKLGYHGARLASWKALDDPRAMDNDVEHLIYLGLSLIERKDRSRSVIGLLLQRVPGSETTFSRVGTGIINDHSIRSGESDKHSVRFIDALETPKRICFLPDEQFDPEHGYKIKIV
jgi:hypothetical protein